MLIKSGAKKVGIVVTKSSNTASLVAALSRLGASPYLVESPEEVLRADYLMLPGVGAFGTVAAYLRQAGMLSAIRTRVALNLPTFAICLGMQLLFERSEESPDVEGVGAISGGVEALANVSAGRLNTHYGWAPVGDPGEKNFAYFAHSYAARNAPADWQPVFAGGTPAFVAEIRKGAVFACQYHPEISGTYGETTLKAWLAAEEIGNERQ